MVARRRRRQEEGHVTRHQARVAREKQKVKLEFAAPEQWARQDLTLYFMADSYLGCDQEYEFTLDVKEGEDGNDDDAMAT